MELEGKDGRLTVADVDVRLIRRRAETAFDLATTVDYGHDLADGDAAGPATWVDNGRRAAERARRGVIDGAWAAGVVLERDRQASSEGVGDGDGQGAGDCWCCADSRFRGRGDGGVESSTDGGAETVFGDDAFGC